MITSVFPDVRKYVPAASSGALEVKRKMRGEAKVALYRHFDAQGRLLYVGITDCLHQRDRQHAATSHWHADVVRTETQWCLSRDHALALEGVAIRFEAPLHNIKGARRAVLRVATEAAQCTTVLDLIEQYMQAHGLPKTAFGIMATGDARFVDDLRAGRRELRSKTVARVMDFIATGEVYDAAKHSSRRPKGVAA